MWNKAPLDTAVFDIDGTLVDSSYHHLLAWSRAFAAVDVTVPCWRLHHYMGMGGDQLVAAAAGDAVEQAVGDQLRDRWQAEYDELLDEVRPIQGAVTALHAFRQAGTAVVLATSGNDDHIDRTLKILGLGRDDFPLVTSGDVEATKPAGDLVELALQKVGGKVAVLIGDTIWDVKAGQAAGVPVLGVLTGGTSGGDLREAGALRLFDDAAAVASSVPDLVAHLDG